MSEIKNRTFEAEGDDFQAYRACTEWLEELGCSIGSMQRGAPSAVMFSDDYVIAKNRNLNKREKWETHGWIHPSPGGRFREGPIRFEVTPAGKAFLESRATLSLARGETR